MFTSFRQIRLKNLIQNYATSASSSGSINPYTVGPFQVFDRNAKRIQKDHAATWDGGRRSRMVDYVRDEIADRMMERFLVSHHCSISAFLLTIHSRTSNAHSVPLSI